MGTLTSANPNDREVVTEVLDETRWWKTLKLIVEFLRAKGVEQVRVEFGFVVDRDIDGQEQGQDQTIELDRLEQFIRTGIEEGTIERLGTSDFVFCPVGMDLAFMLCNDGDLHFASTDPLLLADVGGTLRSSEIKVYDS